MNNLKRSLGYEEEETKLVVYYDIQDISSPTTVLTNYTSSVKSMEIDGSETISEIAQGNVTYQFDKVGEHVVKYEFNDPTAIGNGSPLFQNLTTIKKIEIPNTFKSVEDYAFAICSGLTSVTIGSGVTSIGQSAFNNCSGLTSVTIGSGVTSIGQDAFRSCSGLTSIEIPNSVTSIGQNAFYYCTSMPSVTIGNGVTSFGGGAFYGCTSLSRVTVKATTPPTLEGNSVFGVNASGRKIYVPSESVNTYQAAINWNTYASDIEAIQ